MTDAVAIQMIVSMATLAAIPLSSWALDKRQDRRAKTLKMEQDHRANQTANQVAEVKDTLAANTAASDKTAADTQKIVKDVHTLVNSNMGEQLLLNKTLSDQLHKVLQTDESAEAARISGEKYSDHQTKQAAVDAAKKGG